MRLSASCGERCWTLSRYGQDFAWLCGHKLSGLSKGVLLRVPHLGNLDGAISIMRGAMLDVTQVYTRFYLQRFW
jgi:hypothetical protein